MKPRTILAALLGVCSGVAAGQSPDYPVRPVPFTAVRVDDSFWTPRFETNRLRTVWCDFQKCEETGRIDNFAKAGRLKPGEFRGTPFDDSDVFKVIEVAAYTLALHPDAKLDQYLDELIRKIGASKRNTPPIIRDDDAKFFFEKVDKCGKCVCRTIGPMHILRRKRFCIQDHDRIIPKGQPLL